MLYSRFLDSQAIKAIRGSKRENPIDGIKKWFRGLSIGRKIGIGYALSIGIAVVGTTGGQIVSLFFIEAPALQLHQTVEQKSISLDLLKHTVDRTHSDLLLYLEHPNILDNSSDDLLDRFEQLDRAFSQVQATANRLEGTDSDISSLNTFLATHQNLTKLYKTSLEKTLSSFNSRSDSTDKIFERPDREILLSFLRSKAIVHLQNLESDLDKIIEESRLEFHSAETIKLQGEILRMRVMYGSLLLSVAIAILFGYYTSLAIARPLQKLTRVSQKACQTSNFDIELPVLSNDEVGILATSFKDLIGRTNTLLKQQKEANDKLEERIEQRTLQLQQKSYEIAAILDAFPDLFFRHAADGTILDFKMGSQEKELYLAPEQFLGKRLIECLPSPIGERLQEAIAETVKTQSLNSIEYSLPMPTGEEYYEARFLPIKTEEVIGVVRNISDRKVAEMAVRASEKKYQKILDAITDMVLVKGENSRIVWANRSFRDFYNMTPTELEELMDARFSESENTLQDVKTDAYVYETGNTLDIEESVMRFDGEVRHFNTIKSAIRHEDGTTFLTVGVSRDISDRKAAEERLRQSEHQLQAKALQLEATLKQLQSTQTQMIQSEKMSSLGQMVAGVAHEINNPISFIHGNLIHTHEYTQDLLNLVKLYQQYCPNAPEPIQAEIEAIDLEFLSEDLEKTLKSMRSGTERIRNIVLSLRNFSRLDEAEFKDANLHEGLDNTLMLLHNRFKDTSKHPEIQLVKEYGNLALIECYPGQLNQVFMNILSNAIDAIDEFYTQHRDSPKIPTIAIRTSQTEDNWLEIKIADNGVGIPESVRSKLFDPFFTTKPIGKGTGLGLSISYQIVVERHGGKLSCQSQIGHGTEFIIELPIRQYVG